MDHRKFCGFNVPTLKMTGKKRRLNKFISKWIKSELPEDHSSSVLLLGVTKIPTSPSPLRRPCTLQLDHRSSPATTTAAEVDDVSEQNHHQKLSSSGQIRRNSFSNNRRRRNSSSASNRSNDFRKNSGQRGLCLNQEGQKYCQEQQQSKKSAVLEREPQKEPCPAESGAACPNGAPILPAAAADQYSDAILPTTATVTRQPAPSSVTNTNNKSDKIILDKNLNIVDHYHHQQEQMMQQEEKTTVPQPAMMERSVDSIGTCSLDVEASADLSDWSEEASSVGTLRSCTTREGAPTPSPKTPSIEPHLPSYLSLACTVNGYGLTTNYDPERLLTRSRDASPHRPPLNTSHNNDGILTGTAPTYSVQNNLLSPPNLVPLPPLLVPPSGTQLTSGFVKTSATAGDNKMAAEMQHHQEFYRSTKTMTFLSKETSTSTSRFASNLIFDTSTNGKDSVDACYENGSGGSHFVNSKSHVTSSYEAKNYHLSSSMATATTTAAVLNGQEKCSFASENSSYRTYTNGKYGVEMSTMSFDKKSLEAILSSHFYRIDSGVTENATKSFIQQRVERLYGPGALAQGFFVSRRQKNRSESESNETDPNSSQSKTNRDSQTKSHQKLTENHQTSDRTNTKSPQKDLDCSTSESALPAAMLKQSTSSPTLPVLRHLRPEFRAQLPIISSPRKSSGGGGTNCDVIAPPTYDAQAQNAMPKSSTVPALLTADKDGNNAINVKLNGHSSDISMADFKKKNDLLSSSSGAVIVSNGRGDVSDDVIKALLIDEQLSGQEQQEKGDEEPTKDGRYFLIVLQGEADRLLKLAEKYEKLLDFYLENDGANDREQLSEEVIGIIRSATGKARLLVSQKMQQFRGLCTNNITQMEGEAFPTTNEDLQGFWDMVMLQVRQVDALFRELDEMKANNWQELKPATPPPKSSSTNLNGDVTSHHNKPILKKVIAGKSRPVSAANEEARKKRENLRKQMIEDRRRAMKAHQQKSAGGAADGSNSNNNIEIFVPESS